MVHNSGEQAYIHHRSSHPLLLENEKHIKSITKMLFAFNPPQNPLSYIINIENRLIEGSNIYPYPEGSIADVKKNISEADIVVILIGAGISACLVPDLISYYQQLNLTIIPSNDSATTSSYLKFCDRMCDDKEYRHSIIKAHQQFSLLLSSHENGLEPSAAHHALSRMVSFLKDQGKEVKVFSSNVDGLEKKAGITLDEENDHETKMTSSMIPTLSEFAKKKSVIISIGKSSDHVGDLSNIYKNSVASGSLPVFYTFNREGKPIMGYELDDSDDVMNTFVLPMTLIQGDIQVTLPQLSEELIQ